jgi:predicted anti-sigma-YlaC factor YlaD
MRHVPDGALRRMLDEPLAVTDDARHHLGTCGRCRAASAEIAENADAAFRALSAAQLTTDSDLAWARLQHQLARPAETRGSALPLPRLPSRRLVDASIRTGTVMAAGVLLAGVGAAAMLTGVYAPARAAPVPVTRGDLHAVAQARAITRLPCSTPGTLPAGVGSPQLMVAAPAVTCTPSRLSR